MTSKFFISHDFSARNDEKILTLRSELGLEGYGIWWAFIEVLAEHDGQIKESNLKGISFSIQCDWDTFQRFFCLCLDLELLHLKEGLIYSESLNKRLEYKREVSKKRSDAGKKGAEIKLKKANSSKSQANAKQMLSKSSANDKQNQANQNLNLNQNQNNKSKDLLEGAKAPALTIDQRADKFKEELNEFAKENKGLYPTDMYLKFYEYWTEPSRSGTKLNFELQKTWSLPRRLSRWADRRKVFDTPQKAISQSFAQQDINQAKNNLQFLRDRDKAKDLNLIDMEGKLING